MNIRFSAGIGIVEIVVVIGIIGIALVGMIQTVVLVSRPFAADARQTQASYLAQEGIEAVRLVRDANWTNNIASLANNTTYYPTLTANVWTLSTSDPGTIDGTYTRTVTLQAVYRDANGNISSSGTLDEKTRKVVSTVSWDEHGQNQSQQLETYITNFQGS